jgi:signal transduction histidine kinase
MPPFAESLAFRRPPHVAEVTVAVRDFRHTFCRAWRRYNALIRTPMRSERWLTVAGFVTWLVAGLPTFVRMADGRLTFASSVLFLSAFALFGLAFGLMVLHRPGPWQKRGWRVGLLAIQSIAGLTMVAASGDVFPASTLVVVAGQLDEVATRYAVAWLIAQTITLGVLGSWFAPLPVAVTIAGVFAGFQLFAMTTALHICRERLAWQSLAAANRELHATRALLAETSRVEERLRISRDLHDALGHHLTALSLRLDVASRLADPTAAEHVRQAHALTRLLLSDVRDVVGRLREGSRVDLVTAMRTLASATQGLTVHLTAPDLLEMSDAARAHALLRSIQEIITNASRHAEARNLWIVVEARADGISLHARDDGRGARSIHEGHGLTGMRERFAEYAGSVEFEAGEGRGFEVRGFMPTPQAAS